MEFISVRDAAAKWGISERCVHKYCEEGRISGLKRFKSKKSRNRSEKYGNERERN